MDDPRGFQTRAIHGGRVRDPLKSVSLPIYQTSTFRFDSVAEGAALGADRGEGWYYTRWGNPTTRLFEEAGFKPEVMPAILKGNAVRLLGLD